MSDLPRLAQGRRGEADETVLNHTVNHPQIAMSRRLTVNNDLEPVGMTTQERHNKNPVVTRRKQDYGEQKPCLPAVRCGVTTGQENLIPPQALLALLAPAKIAAQN